MSEYLICLSPFKRMTVSQKYEHTTIGHYCLLNILYQTEGEQTMALKRMLGFSDGELMRSDAKPCSRLMRHTAGICSVGGALGFWTLCRLYYGMYAFILIPSLINAFYLMAFYFHFGIMLGSSDTKFTNHIILFVFILFGLFYSSS